MCKSTRFILFITAKLPPDRAGRLDLLGLTNREKSINSIFKRYVFEELGEIYLLKGMTSDSQKYFGLAYYELSKNEGIKVNEAKRLSRIKDLAGIQ